MQRWQEDKKIDKVRGWTIVTFGPQWRTHWKIRDRQCEAFRGAQDNTEGPTGPFST